jgi:integral membrane sensor domain MASE1/two-component sensor histidine kinase
MIRKYIGYFVKITILFVTYFLTARVGLSLDAVSGFATLVWPPTGIALAALILYGYRLWPGIALAAFAVNVVVGAPLLAATGIAFGNTLEALIGAYLLKQFVGFQPSLARLKDVIGLVIFAGFLSTMVAATIGVGSLVLSGTIDASSFMDTWKAWRLGDMLGALVVAPLLLVWSQKWHERFTLMRLIEATLFAVILGLVSACIFFDKLPHSLDPLASAYLVFPILILIALRFGQRGSALAVFTVVVISISGTIDRFYPDLNNHLSDSLLFLQSFMAVMAVTFMIMAAFVTERSLAAESKLRLLRRAIHLMKQRQSLEATYHMNERQTQIVNDLLSTPKADTSHVTLKKTNTDLRRLSIDVIEKLKPVIGAKKQTIELVSGKDNFNVKVDKQRVAMALENLIINASKYSYPGRNIEVVLTRKKSWITLTVEDQGVGVGKNDIRKLFKKFSRIDNELSTEAGGNGLGLYWTKSIIKLHGGRVTVTPH